MHDVELAKRFADRIVGMAGGRIVFDGPPAKLSDDTLKRSTAARAGCDERATRGAGA